MLLHSVACGRLSLGLDIHLKSDHLRRQCKRKYGETEKEKVVLAYSGGLDTALYGLLKRVSQR